MQDPDGSAPTSRRARKWGYRILVAVIGVVFVVSAVSVGHVAFRFHYTVKMKRVETEFAGVPLVQIPNDLWAMQELISEIAPDFVVETGTWHAGSAIFYASVLQQVNPKARVITVDVEPLLAEASRVPLFKRRVSVITGDSVSPRVVGEIERRVKGHTVLVTLDSLHSDEHVSKELELYSPMVSIGSYIVVQDTWLPGPRDAVERFLESHAEFEVDHSREKWFFTKFESGFLKRVR